MVEYVKNMKLAIGMEKEVEIMEHVEKQNKEYVEVVDKKVMAKEVENKVENQVVKQAMTKVENKISLCFLESKEDMVNLCVQADFHMFSSQRTPHED